MASNYSKKINEGLSAKTVNNIHGVLHKALDNAVRWNLVPPKVVQEILGHSQITTTMDIYSHAMPSLQDDATQQWDDKFGKKGKKKGKK